MILAKPTVYSVAQLNNYVKTVLDKDENLSHIFVSGEISNFKAHYSGHFYMTIKDENASVKAVMFSSYAQKLRFTPENGMKVIILGTVSLFARDGSYQLYINDMQPDGVGSLNIAFEQLKSKLEKEGLFRQEYKKSLPQFPAKIGVVTSATGAALQDILNVLKRRYPVAEVVVRPCQVQGEGAAEDIACAISEFNAVMAADVLIVGRGGGSIEDLWAFNEEIVARAVFDSKIPVISAVGHETDFTICDFVADFRAPTPSAAAECAAPDIIELKTSLVSYKQFFCSRIKNELDFEREKINYLNKTIAFYDPATKLNDKKQELVYLGEKLQSLVLAELENYKSKYCLLAGKLDALSPLGVISRGYALAQNEFGSIVTGVDSVSEGDRLSVRLSDGTLNTIITTIEHN